MSSATSRIFIERYQTSLVVLIAVALSAGATLFVYRSGWTLDYGDAEAHLDIARRVLDSRTPGYSQLGTVWLPLPHALMLPFVGFDRLWRTGLAGAIPASACFVASVVFLFAAARRIFHSSAAAAIAAAILAFNPNLLYLQATPMTEPVFLAALMALLYFLVRFEQTQSIRFAVCAGVAGLAAGLSRYDGWFLLPFAAVAIFAMSNQHRFRATLVFTVVAAAGPAYWLIHNWYLYGNALEFYNGPYSAHAIFLRGLQSDPHLYPGYHDWRQAFLYFRTAASLCAGPVTLTAAACGLPLLLWKKIFWPVLFLCLPPVFYVWSLHSSGTPIFVPSLWPYSFYNTRYGLAALPLLALSSGGLAISVPSKLRGPLSTAIVMVVIAGAVSATSLVCWTESQRNAQSRKAWISGLSSYLVSEYRARDGIFTSVGELAGVYRAAGIPFRETLNEGNQPEWIAAVHRPQFFLHERWVIAPAGSEVANAIECNRAPYRAVAWVNIKDGPAIRVYERTHDE